MYCGIPYYLKEYAKTIKNIKVYVMLQHNVHTHTYAGILNSA
jgi:hypothetical protein